MAYYHIIHPIRPIRDATGRGSPRGWRRTAWNCVLTWQCSGASGPGRVTQWRPSRRYRMQSYDDAWLTSQCLINNYTICCTYDMTNPIHLPCPPSPTSPLHSLTSTTTTTSTNRTTSSCTCASRLSLQSRGKWRTTGWRRRPTCRHGSSRYMVGCIAWCGICVVFVGNHVLRGECGGCAVQFSDRDFWKSFMCMHFLDSLSLVSPH